MKLKIYNYLFLTVLAIFMLSCSLTTTKVKTVEFTDAAQLEKALTSLIKAEHININGKEIIKNNQSSTELEISVINGQNIPETVDDQKSLGKSIASCVKKYLKIPSAFDSYLIKLVKQTESTGVKVETSKDMTFKISEL